MERLSDISLVARVVMFHDRRAFDSIVRKYQSAVRRFFLNHTLGDVQLSDDLAQDTFVKAYVSLAQFRGKSGLGTWLLRIACNVFYDYVRAHRPTGDIEPFRDAWPGSGQTDTSLRMDVYDALARLKPVERSCITLQLIDGLPVDRIAEITGLPSGTVKSHLSRGKEKLAAFLKSNGY